ncbi:MAG TPA: histidinol-phosphate transaminase [Kofleriaceae bacterium]
MGYERANIARMHGYVPGKQPASSETIKLNTNENPYPPCDAVLRELTAIPADALRRYPPPSAEAFRDRAAALHGLGKDQVVAVNGGDELLRLVLTTFVEPGRPIGVIEPSYSLYPVLAQIHDSPVVRADAEPDWSWPADLAERMNDAGAALLLVVNPHAPSGVLTPAARIAELARAFRGVLLVDEAYVDFVDPELGHDVVGLIASHDNLLVLRTLSKGYSLAGLRFGYGLGAGSLIAPLLWKTRDSYNVDVIAQRLASAALAARAQASETWRKVRSERARVAGALQRLGFALAGASQSNFVLATAPASASAPELQQALEQRGVLVRYFPEPRLAASLRITIGTPEQNDRLLSVLAELL